jgi:hypothetical protein
MLNTEHFILLAGNPHAWDEEIRQRCRSGSVAGTFQSQDLCSLQVEQAGRGRLSAHLVLSIYGWSVRYASGLQDFGILRRADSFDPASALYWGCQWVSVDPDSRELYVSRSEIERAEAEGHNCDCLRELETITPQTADDGTS